MSGDPGFDTVDNNLHILRSHVFYIDMKACLYAYLISYEKHLHMYIDG